MIEATLSQKVDFLNVESENNTILDETHLNTNKNQYWKEDEIKRKNNEKTNIIRHEVEILYNELKTLLIKELDSSHSESSLPEDKHIFALEKESRLENFKKNRNNHNTTSNKLQNNVFFDCKKFLVDEEKETLKRYQNPALGVTKDTFEACEQTFSENFNLTTTDSRESQPKAMGSGRFSMVSEKKKFQKKIRENRSKSLCIEKSLDETNSESNENNYYPIEVNKLKDDTSVKKYLRISKESEGYNFQLEENYKYNEKLNGTELDGLLKEVKCFREPEPKINEYLNKEIRNSKINTRFSLIKVIFTILFGC